MSILTVARGFASVVGMELPDRIFGSEDRTAVEVAYLAQDCAETIAEVYDWRGLARTFTIPAGVLTFEMPADFARFRLDTALMSDLGHVLNRIDRDAPDYFPLGGWYVIGRTVYVKGGPGGILTGAYQSNEFITPASAQFNEDGDTFVLSERVLRLCMIWKWKANKGLPYGQDYDSYEAALGKAIAHDGPREVISVGGGNVFGWAKLAWPGVLGP